MDLRLESSVGAVDQVPVADLLQDQQGARLVTLTAGRGESHKDGRTVCFKSITEPLPLIKAAMGTCF